MLPRTTKLVTIQAPAIAATSLSDTGIQSKPHETPRIFQITGSCRYVGLALPGVPTCWEDIGLEYNNTSSSSAACIREES